MHFGFDVSPAWGLVITGGETAAAHTALNSVFATRDGSTFDELDDLPVGMRHHCAVLVDDERLFVAGGLDSPKNTFVYSRSTR